MVGDGEGRDAERCVKLATPFGGLRGFISGLSRSHPPPWDSQVERAANAYKHTRRALAAELACETLRY